MKLSDEALARGRLWMEYVVRDMQAMRLLEGQPLMEAAVCFHAQQAAEKALKAYLAALCDEDIPRTHDLRRLHSLVLERGGEKPPTRGLLYLNQHAVASRYPEEEFPTPEEAQEAVEFASEIVGFVRGATGMVPDDTLQSGGEH
jgi:HEPN domain-containing protein